MIGQHIYMRCLVPFFSKHDTVTGGTLTAAMTRDILPQQVVLDHVEKHCVLKESFAKRMEMRGSDRTVLKIHHPADNCTVATRISWVQNTLLESRDGSYAFSLVGTGPHHQSLAEDVSCLFLPDNYERYGDVVSRLQASGSNRLETDTRYDRPRPGAPVHPDRVFAALNVTPDLFRQYLSGVIQAVGGGEKLAVILPDNNLPQWTAGGEDLSESLLHATLELLPTFLRKRLSAVSHWDCELSSPQLTGIQLVFINPEGPERVQQLAQDGAAVVDLRQGRAHNIDAGKLEQYGEFVWRHLGDGAPRQRLEQYLGGLCGSILDTTKITAEIMEYWFLMYRTHDTGFGDKELTAQAFSGAVKLFGGLADQFPEVEQYFRCSIQLLAESGPSPDTLTSLSRLIRSDQLNLSYSDTALATLIHAVSAGQAPPSCADDLVGELEKHPAHTTALLLRHVEQSNPSPTLPLLTLLHAALDTVVDQRQKLYLCVEQRIIPWVNTCFEQRDWPCLEALINWYGSCLSMGIPDPKQLAAAYFLLMRLFHADSPCATRAGKVLQANNPDTDERYASYAVAFCQLVDSFLSSGQTLTPADQYNFCALLCSHYQTVRENCFATFCKLLERQHYPHRSQVAKGIRSSYLELSGGDPLIRCQSFLQLEKEVLQRRIPGIAPDMPLLFQLTEPLEDTCDDLICQVLAVYSQHDVPHFAQQLQQRPKWASGLFLFLRERDPAAAKRLEEQLSWNTALRGEFLDLLAKSHLPSERYPSLEKIYAKKFSKELFGMLRQYPANQRVPLFLRFCQAEQQQCETANPGINRIIADTVGRYAVQFLSENAVEHPVAQLSPADIAAFYSLIAGSASSDRPIAKQLELFTAIDRAQHHNELFSALDGLSGMEEEIAQRIAYRLGHHPTDSPLDQVLAVIAVLAENHWSAFRYGSYLNYLPSSHEVANCIQLFSLCETYFPQYSGLIFPSLLEWLEQNGLPALKRGLGDSHIQKELQALPPEIRRHLEDCRDKPFSTSKDNKKPTSKWRYLYDIAVCLACYLLFLGMRAALKALLGM